MNYQTILSQNPIRARICSYLNPSEIYWFSRLLNLNWKNYPVTFNDRSNSKSFTLPKINLRAVHIYEIIYRYGPNKALIQATKHNKFKIVKFLLEIGIKPDDTSYWTGFCIANNWTALMIASDRGYEEIVRLLLEFKAQIHVTYQRYDAIRFASRNGHTEIVSRLVIAGAEYNPRNQYVSTPLMVASANGHIETVRFLIKIGADLNEIGRNPTSALHCAAENGCVNVMRLLIEEGADIHQRNFQRSTALILAAKGGWISAVTLLLENGANIGDENRDRQTALIVAVENDHCNLLPILIEAGADVNAGYPGRSLLKLARDKRNLEMIIYLQLMGARD